MKNIFASVPTFVVELKFSPLTDEDQDRLQQQVRQEKAFAWRQYCDQQAFLSTLTHISLEPCLLTTPKVWIKCQAVITDGPKQLGEKTFHYPLTVKTINMLDPAIWTAQREFYPDEPRGIADAQSKVIYDIRDDLSSYDINDGYAIRLKSDYGGDNLEQHFGPFTTSFKVEDTDFNPEYLVKSLFWGFNGSPYRICKYIQDEKTSETNKEIARKGLSEFCQWISNPKHQDRDIFSTAFLDALKDFASQIISDEDLSILKRIPKTLNQSRTPPHQPKSLHNGPATTPDAHPTGPVG